MPTQTTPYHPIPKIRVPIRNTEDYSPFGVQLDGRTISMNSYRYGFNGMEKDDEVKGGGNSFDFGSRMYDPRTGRWFTTDKNQNNYPAWSTYSGFGDNPIFNVDKDGNDFIFFAGAGYKGENEQKKFNKSFTSTMSEILGDNFSVVPFINNGALTDVAWGMKNGYTPIQNIDEDQVMLCAISHVEEVISGLECGEPLNMVGSSYGSATAAQTTFYLLEHASEYELDNVQISLTLSSKMLAEDSPLIKALIAKASEKDSKFILVFQDFPEDNVNGLAGGSLLDKDLLPVIFPHIGSEGYQTSMLNPWGNHTHNEMAQSTAKTYDLVNLMLYTLKLEGLSTSEKAKTVLDRKKNTTIVNDKLDTKLESPSDNHGVPSF